MVSVPEGLEECPEASIESKCCQHLEAIESKGCRHLEEHEPRHACDLEDPDVDEDLEEGPVHPPTNLKLFVSTSMPTRDLVKWTNGSGRRGGDS